MGQCPPFKDTKVRIYKAGVLRIKCRWASSFPSFPFLFPSCLSRYLGWRHLARSLSHSLRFYNACIRSCRRNWGSSWKPTKLITSTDQIMASAIHQLRLGHRYLKPFLIDLPSYNSTQCQCSGSPKCQTPTSRLRAIPEQETTSRNYQRDYTARPPFHFGESDNVVGLHPHDRGSYTGVAATTGRRERGGGLVGLG